MSASAKFHTLVIGKVPDDLCQRLSAVAELTYLDRSETMAEAELIAAASQADVFLTEPYVKITPSLIAACPKLIMVAQRAVGYDNINIKDCQSRPILLTNTPGVLDNATADLAFALMLAAGRRIVEADRYVREGHWQGFENDLLLGTEISGRTLGIVGMGRIGSAMARRAHGFGMKIIYSRSASGADKHDQKDQQWQSELGATRVDFDNLLSQSDFISLHCPHNKSTEKLIGAAQFASMKKNCIFVNTSRGKVVDEDALCMALTEGQIRGAGLDVFYNEPQVSQVLLQSAKVVLAPHIGSASEETRYAMAELAVDSVIKALAGQLPGNAVNGEIFDEWLKHMQKSTVPAQTDN